MAVVSISRQFGAGGRTLGVLVAAELGYHFLHESQLDRLADKAAGGDLTGARERPEPVSPAGGGASHLTWRPATSWTAGPAARATTRATYNALTQVIQELADEGKVVMLGRGSQFILRYRPDTVRILLVAELPHRIGFMTKNYNMDQATAKRLIEEADKKRTRFLNNFYPGEPDEASLYHLVLNTSLLSLEGATTQVTKLVKRIDSDFKTQALA